MSIKIVFGACIKITIVVGCLLGFILNSIEIFSVFSEKSTVSTSNTENEGSLFYPSITICASRSYKHMINEFSDIELHNYFNNTIRLSETIDYLYHGDFNSSEVDFENFDIYYESDHLRISTTYTLYKGRCYTLDYKNKVYCPQN